MLRADLLVTSPCLLIGLSQVFTEAKIRIVATRTSAQEEPCWLADVAVIDADAVPTSDLEIVTDTARSMTVLVLVNEVAGHDADYLGAGAAGVVGKGETGAGIVRAVELATVRQGRPAATAYAATVPAATHGRGRGHHEGRAERPRLSNREEQVLAHIAHGRTHGQVATRLGISPHTVDTYVKRLRVKLGAGNKAELTRAALLGRYVNLGDLSGDPPAEARSLTLDTA